MFNSLLILLPVIGARAVANAYDQDLTSREGAAEALQHASEKLLDELATIGPRDENSKLPYWQDRIVAELDARNMSAVRGYMLAAPQMLGRDLGDMVAARHMPAAELRRWRASTRLARFATGAAGTGLFFIPFANLIAPIVGAAMATHMFHRRNAT